MAGQKVTIEMDAKNAGLVQAWLEAKRGPEAFAAELEKVKGKARDAKGVTDDMTRSTVAGAVKMQAAFSLAAEAAGQIVSKIREVIEAQRQLDRERNQGATTYQEAIAKFSNQAQLSGLSGAQRRALGQGAARVGTVFGIAPEQGAALATELVSQGVDARNAPGVLAQAAKFSAAQGSPLDRDTLRALTAQTRVNDPTLSPAGFEQTSKAFFGAFLGRQIQPQQLEPFSKVNLGLRAAGMSPTEQIAFNTASLDLYGGDASQAATFDRAFISKLRAPTPEGQGALAQLVGGHGNVDFVGENMTQVLERLGTGFEKMPAEQRAPLAKLIFGEEFGAMGIEMASRRGNYAGTLSDIEKGASRFDASAMALLNTDAGRQRSAAAQEAYATAINGNPAIQTVEAGMDAELERRKASALNKALTKGGFHVMQTIDRMGGSYDEQNTFQNAANALSDGRSDWTGVPDANVASGLRGSIRNKSDNEIADILREISKKLDDKGVIVEENRAADNANRSVPQPAPMAALQGN